MRPPAFFLRPKSPAPALLLPAGVSAWKFAACTIPPAVTTCRAEVGTDLFSTACVLTAVSALA
jgi:hypothetical protein